MSNKFIGIDFDGTMVTHAYPEIGTPLEGAVETVLELIDAGHKIILYTMRSGERLVQAVEYLEQQGIKLFAVNDNPTQKHWTESRKIFCHVYIDDAALGCPLVNVEKSRPYVDWTAVTELLQERGLLL